MEPTGGEARDAADRLFEVGEKMGIGWWGEDKAVRGGRGWRLVRGVHANAHAGGSSGGGRKEQEGRHDVQGL